MDLVLISIGKPEVGMKLCEHLGLEDGEKWIFAGKITLYFLIVCV